MSGNEGGVYEARPTSRPDRPVARLVVTPPEPPKRRPFGTLGDLVLSMEHFDDPLDDFAEYR
jgi:hypothetical protein